jgi:hypothetical protein
MNVIAFRPRSGAGDTPLPRVHGTFRSPRGRRGVMTGALRVQRLVLVPRGTFVTGVFTGELRDEDGTLVGVASRRATVAADLVQDAQGFHPWVRPFALDLMGIAVHVSPFLVEPAVAFPRLDPMSRRPRRGMTPAAPPPDQAPAGLP